MTAKDFTAWMDHMGWNIQRTAIGLGIGRNTVSLYMKDGAPEHIGLACSALAYGLPRWKKA